MTEDVERVLIVGPNGFSLDLLKYAVMKEFGVACDHAEELEELPVPERRGTVLVLVDAHFVDLERFLMEHLMHRDGLPSAVRIAYFNLAPRSGGEQKAMRHGVRGFFYTNNSLDLFLKGIRAMLAGEIWVSRDVLVQLVVSGSESQNNEETGKKQMLTNREREVLTFLCLGRTNEDIAEALFISDHTVKTHVYNIFKKINVPNRLQAALWASKHL